MKKLLSLVTKLEIIIIIVLLLIISAGAIFIYSTYSKNKQIVVTNCKKIETVYIVLTPTPIIKPTLEATVSPTIKLSPTEVILRVPAR